MSEDRKGNRIGEQQEILQAKAAIRNILNSGESDYGFMVNVPNTPMAIINVEMTDEIGKFAERFLVSMLKGHNIPRMKTTEAAHKRKGYCVFDNDLKGAEFYIEVTALDRLKKELAVQKF